MINQYNLILKDENVSFEFKLLKAVNYHIELFF
jgi:hypothetical protein